MTTKLSNEGLRKAAILVASLDTAAADAVLDQLTPEQARQVREIVVELDDIDQSEQRRVIDEFFHSGAAARRARNRRRRGTRRPPGVAGLARPPRDEEAAPMRRRVRRRRPFSSCRRPRPTSWSGRSTNERPQTIALVLSHLPPARAGAVLARLPENMQVEVVQRLVDLEETDPEILREVEEALRGRLS